MSMLTSATTHFAEICGLRPHLMRIAVGRMRDRDTAEEVVQETLATACAGAPTFERRSSLRTWVTGILLHKVADAFRAMSRDPLALRDDAANGDDPDFDFDGRWRAPVQAWSDPETALECSRFRAAFETQVAKLPPLQARAFTMRELQGLEAAQIGAALGVTESHLWVILHRARLNLRRGLAGEWFSR